MKLERYKTRYPTKAQSPNPSHLFCGPVERHAPTDRASQELPTFRYEFRVQGVCIYIYMYIYICIYIYICRYVYMYICI